MRLVRNMKIQKSTLQHGFSLIMAIFLMTVLASLGAFMVSIGGVQRSATSLSILEMRAYYGAMSGASWGAWTAFNPPCSCGAIPVTTTFNYASSGLQGISVAVSCYYTKHKEVSYEFGTELDYQVFFVDAIATYGNFGNVDYVRRRFRTTVTTPDHFDITTNTPIFRDGRGSWASSFTYMGHWFGFATNPILTVIAKNASGNTTTNYGNEFWRLTGSLSNRTYTDAANVSATFLTPLSIASAVSTGYNNYDGMVTLSIIGDELAYERQTALQPYFNANVDLLISAADLTDADGICYDGNVDGVCDSRDFLGITGTQLRFGRLIIQNDYGQNTTALNIPITLQYLNAAGRFVTNVDDVDTLMTLANISQLKNLTYISTGLDANSTTTASMLYTSFSNGVNGISYTTPGDDVTGYIDISLDLSSYLLVPLRYDWDENGSHDDNPDTVRATFGAYAIEEGKSGQVFIRESVGD